MLSNPPYISKYSWHPLLFRCYLARMLLKREATNRPPCILYWFSRRGGGNPCPTKWDKFSRHLMARAPATSLISSTRSILSEHVHIQNIIQLSPRFSRPFTPSRASTIQGQISSLLFLPVILPLRIPCLLSHLSCHPCSALVNMASVFTSHSHSSVKIFEEQGRLRVQSDRGSCPLWPYVSTARKSW